MRTGRYLSFIPEFWLQLPNRHPFLRKLQVELPIVGAPIGIVTLKNRKPSPVVQRFIDCARDVAKSTAEAEKVIGMSAYMARRGHRAIHRPVRF